MDKLSYKVAEYEGPLDLLLYLISKHKLNIEDIEISVLLAQYLEHISNWERQNLEIASEFLDMASRLIHLKTISLLPRHEEEQEKEKAELVGQLIEYAACKRAAAELSTRNLGQVIFTRSPAQIEMDLTYRLSHLPEELLRAYLDAAGKGRRRLPPEQSTFSPLVARPMVSVASRIMHIMRRMYHKSTLRMSKLFVPSDAGRSEMVATFLAVLELIKSKRVSIDDENAQLTFHRTPRTTPSSEGATQS